MLSPGAPQFAIAQAAGTADPQAALAAVVEISRSVRESLDRTTFDVEELSLELAFEEPEAIIALVREEVAFEQYPGLLRGAQGTLVSGAGNALDQAVLLATLLGAAGFDTRIALGRLSTEQAEELLRSMQPTAATRDGAPISTQEADQLARMMGFDTATLEAASESAQADMSALRADADEVAKRLESTIMDAGLFAPGAIVPALVEEARDYYWVEYGLGGADWTAAHVLFDEGEAVSIEATDYLTDSIPEELQHRFRFQVFLEQRRGDELEVKPVIAAWERPAANMFGIGMTYVSLPDGIAAEGVDTDVEAILDETTFFIPLLNDNTAAGAMSFDLEGNTVAPDDAANPAAGIFQTVGGAFGDAAGALAGESDPDDFVALTAQWIEYTLIAPGGEETVHRRMVFDRIADREAGGVELDPAVSARDAARALATTFTFMLDTGHYSQAYVTDRGAAVTLAAEPMLRDSLEIVANGEDTPPVVPTDYQAMSRGMDHLRLYATFDDGPVAADRVSYRAEPSLVVVERAWSGEWARVDVVNNSRRVLEHEPGNLPSVDIAGAIATGTWETRVEGMPVAATAEQTHNAFSALAASWDAGVMKLIPPGDTQVSEDLKLPQVSKAAIAEDLERGYAVIVPTETPADAELVAWWRVDPSTGETLGRGGDGRGATLAEYLHEQAVAAALLKGGLILGGTRLVSSCLGKGSAAAVGCCLYEGALINAGMVAIGAIIAAYFAIPAIILFVALDLGVGGALLVGGLMNALPSMCSGITGGCRVGSLV